MGSRQPGMPVRTPPPSRLHPPSQPPTCCRGGQKSIRSRSGRARRQTKTSPRAGPESGFALKAVTCQWHCREGVLHVVYLQRILLGHPQILKSWDRAGGCPIAVDNHVPWLKKKKIPIPFVWDQKALGKLLAPRLLTPPVLSGHTYPTGKESPGTSLSGQEKAF